MKTKITLLLVLLLSTSFVFAQKLKYKDLYPVIASRQYNDDILLTKLKEYKRLSPEEGNQYYQMGKLYFRRIDKFDVLKQLNGALQVADSGLYYFKRAKEVINEKEVKKKEDYYLEFLTSPEGATRPKVTIQVVFQDIDYMVKKLEHYKRTIKTINEHFNHAVNNYYEANTIFTEIYGTYSTFKEMCLLADDAFFAKMKKMDTHFKKAIENLDLYKNDIKTFPIEGYNQDYTLKSIDNYRLHGLTKANFLSDRMELWNYGEWYTTTLKYIEDEIEPLRNIIIQDEKALNSKLNRIKNSSIPDESDYRIESDVLLLIKKYDPASFLVDIFKYKESKINLINSQIFEIDSSDFASRSRSYSNTIIHARSSIKSLNKANKDLSDHLINRHKLFFEEYYNNDLSSFIEKERSIVEPILDEAIESLKLDMSLQKEVIGSKRIIHIDKINWVEFPLYKQDSLDFSSVGGEFVTLDIYVNKNKTYLSGYKLDEGKRKAFVTYMENDSVKWIGYPKIGNGMEAEVAAITSIGNGCVFLMHAFETGNRNLGVNILVEFTNLGKELLSTELSVKGYPKDIVFSESDNLFTAVLSSDSTATVVKMNQEGKSEWSTQIDMIGEVVSLNSIDDNYVLTCNVTETTDELGNKLSSGATGFNVFTALITDKGEYKSSHLMESSLPHYATYVFNNLDNGINVFGFNGVRELNGINGEELMILWLDEDLQLIDAMFESR